MDTKDIKTIEQAKALAFDAIQAIEIQQANLRALLVRIQELHYSETSTKTDHDKNVAVEEPTSDKRNSKK